MQQLCGFMQQSGNNIFVVCANNFSVFQYCPPIFRLSFLSFFSFSHKPKISAKLFYFSVSLISSHQARTRFKKFFLTWVRQLASVWWVIAKDLHSLVSLSEQFLYDKQQDVFIWNFLFPSSSLMPPFCLPSSSVDPSLYLRWSYSSGTDLKRRYNFNFAA